MRSIRVLVVVLIGVGVASWAAYSPIQANPNNGVVKIALEDDCDSHTGGVQLLLRPDAGNTSDGSGGNTVGRRGDRSPVLA
jgi:hypothetical protein